MANFRGGLYTAARAMGDLNAAMKVKQRGGHTMRRLLDQKNLSGITEITVGYLTNKRYPCLLYTSPSPRDRTRSRMPSSA